MNSTCRSRPTHILSVFFALLTSFAAAEETTPVQLESAVEQRTNHPATALAMLQSLQENGKDAFVMQGDLDPVIRSGGGGACASAAAIDAVQALRVMAGLDPLENPHRAALAAFARQDELLNGRVTSEQMSTLLRSYAAEHLEGRSLSIEIQSTPLAPYSPKANTWSVTKGPDFSVAHGQLKVVTFTVTKESGTLLGRHFVLLKSFTGNEIAVVDPNRPLKKITYTVSSRAGDDGCSHVFLVPPPKVQSSNILEVDTIFTLTIADEAGPVRNSSDAAIELRPIKRRIDETAEMLRASGELRSPRKWREKSAVFGLPGLDLPTQYGGANWSAAETLEVFIHAGRHDLNCRDIVGGAHARLLLKSVDPLVLDIVREVAAGKAYVAITMTEPHAGSDFHAITSTAKKVDGGYLLTGEKRYVARLEQATHVIVFTQPASGERKGLSAFVLPIDTPGLERYSFGAHGLKGNSFGGLKFSNLFVGQGQLVGADGEGDKIFTKHFRYWRLMQVGAALGTAERALEMMAERLSSREAYGGPIGRFSHLQQALGQHTTELRMAKSLAREAATMIDRGELGLSDPIISGLKAEGVEISLRAVDAATRAFGAEGYSDRVDLGDRLQDLNGLRIADGTTDVMRMDVVRRSYTNGDQLWEMAVRGKYQDDRE